MKMKIKYMVNVKKLATKPKVFHRLTGLTPQKFQWLASRVETLFIERDVKQKAHSNRKRAMGAGPKRKLTTEQALLGLLLYYRTYTNHVFMGMILGIDDSNVGRYFSKIEPLLAGIFKIPKRKIDMGEEAILALIIDATEQPSQRRPGSGYSGKKKQRTVKTQIAVTPQGTIKSISKSIAGNVHDKKLYDQTRVYTLQQVKRKADLGYLGTSCQLPHKKPKNRALTTRQKEYNQIFSSERIKVEHVIAHLKKFQILAQRFRNPIKKHSLIFKNVAGLRNLQIA
jgi:hypothetical protein